MIPFVNLKKQYRSIKKEIDVAIQSVIKDAAFSGGIYVEKFEKRFAKYLGAKHVVCLNSGTSALHLAILALGVGAGDEVIVPANTFIATAWAVSYVGAKPIFIDCTKDTWQIDSTKIEASITKKTKAIIGVHLFGQPFNIDSVLTVAKKHRLFLVEDCAQANGAKYKGRMVGTLGDIACFSFYPSKNLGAYGEAGAIATNNMLYANRIRLLRNHASVKKYQHEEIGFNMRMDGIQAAILDVKLKYLANWNRRRREIAKIYQTDIKSPYIGMQSQPKWAESVYYVFVVTTQKRDKFMQHLKKHKIDSLIHYPIPCHRQNAYRHLGYKKGDLPVAEDFSAQCVSIPLYPEMTSQELKRICRIINRYAD